MTDLEKPKSRSAIFLCWSAGLSYNYQPWRISTSVNLNTYLNLLVLWTINPMTVPVMNVSTWISASPNALMMAGQPH